VMFTMEAATSWAKMDVSSR